MYSIYTSEKKGFCRTSNPSDCCRERLQKVKAAAEKEYRLERLQVGEIAAGKTLRCRSRCDR